MQQQELTLVNEVILTSSQREWADSVARDRHTSSTSRGDRERHGHSAANSLRDHRIGARGELACSLAIGLPWTATVNTYQSEPDLRLPDGRWVQVKTRSAHWYELIFRPRDSDDHVFCLMTSEHPFREFLYRGWILGADARNPAFKQDHGGRPTAYFVPHAALNTTTLLRRRRTVAATRSDVT